MSAFEFEQVGGGVMTKLTAITLSADAASFDIQNILQVYSHLRLILKARSARASQTEDNCCMRFNGDSGTNYETQYVQHFGTTNSANEYLAQNSFGGSGVASPGDFPAASSPSGAAAHIIIDIMDYAGTTWRKTYTSMCSATLTDSANGQRLWMSSGEWRSTAAITRIQIFPANANLVAGSKIWLYGIL